MTVRSGSIAAITDVLSAHTFTRAEHGGSTCTACGWHGNHQHEQHHVATAIADRLRGMRVLVR
ncbi:hypothetical protein [Mycobacterium sp. 155]|uniref:hypothetical protein n=1 Tax=Mycobacterium sp. 155 TaxID=1157943 RepID=UPI0003A2634E|nr:hypothetical protein [Mycobacterium sp. 155]